MEKAVVARAAADRAAADRAEEEVRDRVVVALPVAVEEARVPAVAVLAAVAAARVPAVAVLVAAAAEARVALVAPVAVLAGVVEEEVGVPVGAGRVGVAAVAPEVLGAGVEVVKAAGAVGKVRAEVRVEVEDRAAATVGGLVAVVTGSSEWLAGAECARRRLFSSPSQDSPASGAAIRRPFLPSGRNSV